jgi:hypothetical protein
MLSLIPKTSWSTSTAGAGVVSGTAQNASKSPSGVVIFS